MSNETQVRAAQFNADAKLDELSRQSKELDKKLGETLESVKVFTQKYILAKAGLQKIKELYEEYSESKHTLYQVACDTLKKLE